MQQLSSGLANVLTQANSQKPKANSGAKRQNEKATECVAFYMSDKTVPLLIFLLLLLGLEKIQVTKGCSKADQHRDNGDKSAGAVSDILF